MPKRGPGKFPDDLTEALWEVTLDGGHDDEIGDADAYGLWAAYISNPEQQVSPSAIREFSKNEKDALYSSIAAIVTADSQGFVEVMLFSTKKEAKKEWSRLEDELSAIDPGEDW